MRDNFIFDSSLVLYLPLYQLDGASLMSRDAYGHLCTVTGALWTPSGREFDGVDDYIDVATHPILNIGTGDFSSGLWINWDIGKQGVAVDFFGGDAGNFVFHKSEVNALHLSDGTDWPEFGAKAVFGEWKQYFAVRKEGVFYTYLDGGAITHFSANWNINFATNPLYIGRAHGFVRYFKGPIGEVFFYNRALTPQEIQHNYLSTRWRYQ